MKEIVLGKSGIRTVQNAFGVLPIQRVDMETAVKILRRAWEGGIRFYDTARDYTDSESKLGAAFSAERAAPGKAAAGKPGQVLSAGWKDRVFPGKTSSSPRRPTPKIRRASGRTFNAPSQS